MKTLFKITASIFGFLFLLLLTGIIVLVTVVSPNNFKNQISQQVNNYTGRELVLQGDLHWSFFPWLGLEINDAILKNAKGFGKDPFAKINHANVAIKLVPLLHRQIEIGKVTLDGLQVHLMKNAKGVTNWQDLTSHVADASDVSVNPVTVAAGTTVVAAKTMDQSLNLTIEGIDITNSQISWVDQQKNQQMLLDHFKLSTKKIATDQAFPLNLAFVIRSNQPAINGNINIQGKITTQLAKQVYQLQSLKVNCNLTGAALPNNKLDLALKGDVTINTENNTLQGQLQTDQLQISNFKASNVSLVFNRKNDIFDLNPIQAQLYQGTYNGNIKINLQNKIPQISSNGKLTSIQVEPLLHDLAKITRLQMTGSGNLTVNVTTKGINGDALVKNLNGQGQFALNNGVLYGINIPYWIGTGVALLQKQPMPVLSNQKQTDFGNLTGTFTITNGVVKNNDLTLKSTQLAASGAGSADLVKQNIDYQLKAQLVDSTTKQPTGSAIPIKITGNLASPSIRPAVNEIIKDQLITQIEKHKDVIGNQIQKLIGKDKGGKLQDQLQKLFNR